MGSSNALLLEIGTKERSISSGGGISKEKKKKRDIHISSERQRRKEMTQKFSTLTSLLPNPKPKADRCSVLIEAMSYIEALKGKMQDLHTKREHLLFQCKLASLKPLSCKGGNKEGCHKEGEEDATVKVNRDGVDVFIFATSRGSHKSGGIIWSRAFQLLEHVHLEVATATLSTTSLGNNFHFIHAKILDEFTSFKSEELEWALQQVFILPCS